MDAYPQNWAGLKYPWKRAELIESLRELSAADPCALWADERRQGLISGIDEVFHFLFDDNDFDDGAVGLSLLDPSETILIEAVKQPLERIVAEHPKGDDRAFTTHRLWSDVRSAAAAALAQIRPDLECSIMTQPPEAR
jgi:hypothetical protein